MSAEAGIGLDKNARLRLSRAMNTDNINGQANGVDGPAVARELAGTQKKLAQVNESQAIRDARARIAAMQ